MSSNSYVYLIQNSSNVAVHIITTVFFLFLLSWLILVVSKIIFKQFFSNEFWKNGFLILIVFPSLLQIYWASVQAVNQIGIGEDTYAGLFDVQTNFILTFFPLFSVFFIAYLIHFIIQIMRYQQQRKVS